MTQLNDHLVLDNGPIEASVSYTMRNSITICPSEESYRVMNTSQHYNDGPRDWKGLHGMLAKAAEDRLLQIIHLPEPAL